MQLGGRSAPGRSGCRRGSRRSSCRSTGRTPAPSRRRRPWTRRTPSAGTASIDMSSVMPSAYGWAGSISQRVSCSTSGRRVRPVAVDLVGGAVDDRRLDAVLAHVLQHVERADGVDVEVGERVAHRPVVRRLGRGVDHHRDVPAVPRRRSRPARRGRGCRRRGGCTRRRGRWSAARTFHAVDASAPKNSLAHVVVDADHVEAEAGEVPDRLRADQTADPVTSATAHVVTPGRRGSETQPASITRAARRPRH